jgi:DNA-directed RNA polymerase
MVIDRQVDLEQTAAQEGAAKYLRTKNERLEKGKASLIPSFQSLLNRSLESLSYTIRAWKISWGGRDGHRPEAWALCSEIDNDVLAYLTLKLILNNSGLTRPVRATATAVSLGSTIEAEACYAVMRREKPGVFRWLKKNGRLDGSTFKYRASALRKAKGWSGFKWEAWTSRQKLLVGTAMLAMVESELGIIELQTVYETTPGGPRRQRSIYALTPRAHEWIETQDLRLQWSNPVFLPMVEEPIPWTSVMGGGLVTYELPFCKVDDVAYLAAQENRDLSRVFGAMNAIQRTPYLVDRDTSEMLQHAWTESWPVKGIPELNPVTVPSQPPEAGPGDDEWKLWKVQCAKTNAHNSREQSRRFSLISTVKSARAFSEDVIYFACQLDSRGRLYPTNSQLSPQGPDQQRGLLRFAESKRLTNDVQWQWLQIHGANNWGIDKAAFSERVEWVETNEEVILAVASDPMSERMWLDADKPFAFLNWCLDYTEALVTERSSIPVAVDATCSGLQHYSALLRDEEGASVTNLSPSKRPSDIYQRVADLILKQVRLDAGSGHSIAKQWLDSGLVNRTLAKRPTMTTPYGVTDHGVMVQTTDLLRQIQTANHGQIPFEDSDALRDPSVYIAPVIIDAIRGSVPKAVEAMQLIRQLVGALAKAGAQARWTVPFTGFEVRQAYEKSATRRVKTILNGEIRKFVLRDRTGGVSRRKAQHAAPPNLIHSMDAAHLMLTVLRMEQASPTVVSYSMVHDSFGVHAADVPLLSETLRESFVELYSDPQLFEHLLDEIAQPLGVKAAEIVGTPQLGNLNIHEVLESPYFFC